MKEQIVLHLIPRDGIGGVEVAARTLPNGSYDGIRYRKYFLVGPSRAVAQDGQADAGPRRLLWNPAVYFTALHFIRSLKPDVIIASLWWAVFAMLIVKLLRPSQKTIIFLHLNKPTHFLDWLINRVGILVADEVWADSQATLEGRYGQIPKRPSRVISFCTRKVQKCSAESPGPVFLFWGRLTRQKNLSRAIRIFKNICAAVPHAKFYIIGPDGGEENKLRQLAKLEGLGNAVRFVGPLAFDGIQSYAKDATFYFQTSICEGMSMATVEAMQMGLIPLVTPVGEIGSYCIHGENSILIGSSDWSCRELLPLIGDPARLGQMSESAVATWNHATLYRDDLMQAVKSFVASQTNLGAHIHGC